MKVKLTKSSLCTCGFPFLKETIPLGTVYNADPTRTAICHLICGGCGRQSSHMSAWCKSRTVGGNDGYLPIAIFEELKNLFERDMETVQE